MNRRAKSSRLSRLSQGTALLQVMTRGEMGALTRVQAELGRGMGSGCGLSCGFWASGVDRCRSGLKRILGRGVGCGFVLWMRTAGGCWGRHCRLG